MCLCLPFTTLTLQPHMSDAPSPDAQSAVFKLLATTERPKTYKLNPSSDLLDKIQAFLPQMAAANALLEDVPLVGVF